jgi:flagellar hook-length control protein FliK
MVDTALPIAPAPAATPAIPATPIAESVNTDFLQLIAQIIAAPIAAAVIPATATTPPASANATDDEPTSSAADMAQLDMVQLLMTNIPALPLAASIMSTSQLPAASPPNSVANERTDAMQTLVLELISAEVQQHPATDPLLDKKVANTPDATVSSVATNVPPGNPVAPPDTMPVSTAAKPDTPAIQAPLGSRHWPDELGARLTWMAHNGQHSASLKLSPEHLGPLEVRIALHDDNTASVWFGAAHAETRAAIEQALPRLRELFSAQGLPLADAGVFREPPRERASSSASASNLNSTSVSDNESASTLSVTRVGLVDAYA